MTQNTDFHAKHLAAQKRDAEELWTVSCIGCAGNPTP